MKGIIVGIQDTASMNTGKLYRVILYKREANDTKYSKQQLPEYVLANMLRENKIQLDNAALVDGKIKGTTGELSRFTANKDFHPMVILSEIVADGQTIGYRTANFDGKIQSIRVKDVIAYCNRVASYGAPFQNAMFVQESATKAHIRAYPGQTFFKEVIQRKKTDEAVKSPVSNTKNNSKNLSKLEELFSPEQIDKLVLAKKKGIDVKIIGNNKLTPGQMAILIRGAEDGINVRPFADPAFSEKAMNAYRINAKYGVRITDFIHPGYNAEQIYELSTGWLSGVDITKFSDVKLSAKDMAKKRVYLESLLWNEVEAEQI